MQRLCKWHTSRTHRKWPAGVAPVPAQPSHHGHPTMALELIQPPESTCLYTYMYVYIYMASWGITFVGHSREAKRSRGVCCTLAVKAPHEAPLGDKTMPHIPCEFRLLLALRLFEWYTHTHKIPQIWLRDQAYFPRRGTGSTSHRMYTCGSQASRIQTVLVEIISETLIQFVPLTLCKYK